MRVATKKKKIMYRPPCIYTIGYRLTEDEKLQSNDEKNGPAAQTEFESQLIKADPVLNNLLVYM